MTRVLCIDIGNSHTVLGLYEGDQVTESWRINTLTNSTSDELYLRLGMLMDLAQLKAQDIRCVGLASVIPAMERPWSKAIHKLLKQNPKIVSSENCMGLKIRYDQPKALGIDRICNVLALKDQGYEGALALDLGTATTFDLLWEGSFYGGCILPGINASLEVLTDRATRLTPVSLEWPKNVIATNTEDALRSGLLNGYVGQIEAILGGIRAELGVENLPVIATGGWSGILSEKCPSIGHFDPHLTLAGIKAVALS